MPFIPIIQPHRDIYIGMWKVQENEDFFYDRLNIYENEAEKLASISHPHRRLEWLSSRLCLKELLKIRHKVESLNETTGRPYLSDHSFEISYSHSNLFASAIASQKAYVSIDLEDLSKQRNLRTRFLFMHPEELSYFEKQKDIRAFFLFWSSKETLYKIAGQKGLVFKRDLRILPQKETIASRGTVPALVIKNGKEYQYTIHYQFFDKVLLTYTFDPIRVSKNYASRYAGNTIY